MAVLDREAYFERLKSRFGEAADDDTLAFLEDMTDTFNDLTTRVGEDWKSKYEENDRAWREKYRSRFFDGVPQEGATPQSAIAGQAEDVKDDSETDKTFDELFEEREG